MISFWIIFSILLFIVVMLDLKYKLLRDESIAPIRPFSFARVQLAWWTIIVLTSFVAIMITTKAIPTLDGSTLILLGISTGTIATSRIIDVSDNNKAAQSTNSALPLSRNITGETFFLDILSDKSGVSIHRLQTVLFNLVFGIWFIVQVTKQLPAFTSSDAQAFADHVMPVITQNNLILIGLSSATYAALKTSENKQ